VSAPVLSLVLPVFNGGGYIAGTVAETCAALEALDAPFEVIVVCDGSTDDTAAQARLVGDERVRVLDYQLNTGKGHAILHGLEQARGRLVGWLDADLDVHPGVIVDAAARFGGPDPVDAVIGSKRHGDSTVSYPAIRRLYSWGFQLLVRLLFRVNARDTQVGAKLFRREMIDTIGPLLLVKRWAFDLEVLAVGAEFGFDRIAEAPIELHYRFTGTSIDWRAVRHMLQDTLAIAYRIHIRHYYVRRFASVERARMDERAGAAAIAAATADRS
jgi:glycosyltransferase involved in cell wall biosynthesis